MRHGVNGLLVPPKDARALAAAISSLVEDRSFRQEAGRRGRQIVDEEFSLARIAGETISAYREVIDGSLASVVTRARRAGV